MMIEAIAEETALRDKQKTKTKEVQKKKCKGEGFITIIFDFFFQIEKSVPQLEEY